MSQANTPAFLDKKYNIIYADPPWSYKDKKCNGNAAQHYNLMKDSDICALPVGYIPKAAGSSGRGQGMGFTYKTIGFQWIKENKSENGHFFGLGRWTRGNTEPCLIGTKGDLFPVVLNEEASAPCLIATKGKPQRISAIVGQLIFSPIGAHSQKPDEVRDRIVELMGDLLRIELFARSGADGWDCWGNEAPTQKQEDESWML